jgi:hypothetical protein
MSSIFHGFAHGKIRRQSFVNLLLVPDFCWVDVKKYLCFPNVQEPSEEKCYLDQQYGKGVFPSTKSPEQQFCQAIILQGYLKAHL